MVVVSLLYFWQNESNTIAHFTLCKKSEFLGLFFVVFNANIN